MSGADIRAELSGLTGRAEQVSQLLGSIRLIVGGTHAAVTEATSGSQSPAASGARDALSSASVLADEVLAHLRAGSASWAEYRAQLKLEEE